MQRRTDTVFACRYWRDRPTRCNAVAHSRGHNPSSLGYVRRSSSNESPVVEFRKMTVITRDLIRHLRQYWHGIHGAPHWARVRANGLRLARKTRARTDVIELFSFLHDSCRLDDNRDALHGERAAAFAETIRGPLLPLDNEGFDLLQRACRLHSHGHMEDDITVMTCWDADRLDLGRVGIRPIASRLCTDAARDPALLGWAYGRSLSRRLRKGSLSIQHLPS